MVRGCNKLSLAPTAAEGFDELNGDDEALAGELGAAAFGLERVAAGVHDFNIADDAGAIAVGGQLGGATGVGDCPVLRRGLRREVMNAGETVFDFAEGDENPLAIFGD